MKHKAKLEYIKRIVCDAETLEQYKECEHFRRSYYDVCHIGENGIIRCHHRSGIHCRNEKVIAELEKNLTANL